MDIMPLNAGVSAHIQYIINITWIETGSWFVPIVAKTHDQIGSTGNFALRMKGADVIDHDHYHPTSTN